jgi:SAM-dependent methyltransferase
MASPKVNLYDHEYGHFALYRDVRVETYGQDFGQTSWVTNEESNEIPRLLEVMSASSVLEIGSGSGGYALHLAQRYACRITALDINPEGIKNANALAEQRKLGELCRFQQCDASQLLPFGDAEFGAVFSNDVLCHIPGRAALLREVARVLKPGGRLLFSDALVIGGMISHEEIATRSSIGYYFFSPPGENERLIEAAGLRLIFARDTTEAAALISKRRHDAREKRTRELVRIEGQANFEGLQRFLDCVHNLTSERRLLRFLYLAERKS